MSAQIRGRLSVTTGLGELDYTAIATTTHTIRVRNTLPSIIQGNGASAVVTTIAVNSTTKYTSNAGDRGVDFQVAATSGDTIKVTTSSSNANDNSINAVVTTITISEGGSL
jgi:hypothetical protein